MKNYKIDNMNYIFLNLTEIPPEICLNLEAVRQNSFFFTKLLIWSS